jgi:hypothetical protein
VLRWALSSFSGHETAKNRWQSCTDKAVFLFLSAEPREILSAVPVDSDRLKGKGTCATTSFGKCSRSHVVTTSRCHGSWRLCARGDACLSSLAGTRSGARRALLAVRTREERIRCLLTANTATLPHYQPRGTPPHMMAEEYTLRMGSGMDQRVRLAMFPRQCLPEAPDTRVQDQYDFPQPARVPKRSDGSAVLALAPASGG